MTKNQKIEKLWSEIEIVENIQDRIILIHEDISTKKNKYKVLAKNDPYRLFQLLGGDEDEISRTNWAYEYTYQDYINQYDIEYDAEDADRWDTEEKSIERAHDLGHWYVTGISIVKGPHKIELEFEFEFCEGYLGGIIGTPYNQNEHGNHGIEFD